MNILFTCAGRRNYLIDYFKEALCGTGLVIAADASEHAPALFEADKSYIVPNIDESNYIDVIIDIAVENKINAIISLNDLELPLLANNLDKIEKNGVRVLVSHSQVIDLCFDKWKTHQTLQDWGLRSPKTYLSPDTAQKAIREGSLSFPLILKPRFGTASIGITTVDNENELSGAYEYITNALSKSMLRSFKNEEGNILIQEKITGTEYGLDVINDLEGNYVVTFIKEKLAMRAGETDRAVTRRNTVLESAGRKIGESLRHIGNLDCDAYIVQGEAYILEMNPRFGGGYPFTHAAGVNLPAVILAWLNGDPVDRKWLDIKPNILSSKCDRLVSKQL